EKDPKPRSIYIVEENGTSTIEFYDPVTDLDKEMYSVDKIVDFDPTKIFDTIEREKENFLNKEIVEVMNNNREIFTVTIKDTDDFLKYVVKKAINDKKINLKNYRHKFDSPYDLNNLKSGLQKDTKMTVTNFKTWCEVLGLKWYMKVEDDGTDKLSPLT
ncbi:hypothetical protein, partial [Brevibacillus sp. MCWH]|uniref:hypothetical protein n=1 Tax=Brevibacillus sp. MCWH TaxID=2508871 RepID=UPI0014915C16